MTGDSETHSSDLPSEFGYETRTQTSLGERVRKTREMLGLGQQALATKVGVSLTTIQNYEGGKFPKGEHAVSLAKALGCTIDWLLTGEGPVYDPKRTKVEYASAGMLRAGEPIKKIVAKQAALDADLLETVIEVIEEALEDSDRELPPTKKAQLVVAIYDLYQDSKKDVDKTSVLRLVKSVA